MSKKENNVPALKRVVCYVHPEIEARLKKEASEQPEFRMRTSDVVHKAILCYFGLAYGGFHKSGYRKLPESFGNRSAPTGEREKVTGEEAADQGEEENTIL